MMIISMDGNNHQVGPLAELIKRRFPELMVGINYLGVRAHEALADSLSRGLDATWTDQPGVDSQKGSSTALLVESMLLAHPNHLFFGSVAFKYQPHEPDPAAAARRALSLGMIPTTSGSATGSPPEASKLESMFCGLLGVASGIDPHNVAELGQHVSHILVSTGISKNFHEFDSDKLALLMKHLPSFPAPKSIKQALPRSKS